MDLGCYRFNFYFRYKEFWLIDAFRIFVKRLFFLKKIDIIFMGNIKKSKKKIVFFSFPLKVSKNIL